MSKSLRGRFGWLALGVSLLGACGAPEDEALAPTEGETLTDSAQALRASDLEVRLTAVNPVVHANEDVKLSVSITNNAKHPVNLLKWYAPLDTVEEAVFQVTRDGEPVAFIGPHYKRPAPAEVDYRRLYPTETLTQTVVLSELYDLSETGLYTFRFAVDATNLNGNEKARGGIESNAVTLWIEGRDSLMKEAATPTAGLTSSISYTKCDATQQATVLQALNAASTYANGAASYLNGTPSATQRYTTWFGAYSSTHWNTAKSHFAAIKDAFDTKPVTVDCGCKKTYYAYVYPAQPYKIYVCKAFWSAPLTGTDSKAGTLIHEMSHFTAVAGTDDWVYGQSGAKSLALSDPTKALNNADNHEYFAENTPALP